MILKHYQWSYEIENITWDIYGYKRSVKEDYNKVFIVDLHLQCQWCYLRCDIIENGINNNVCLVSPPDIRKS